MSRSVEEPEPADVALTSPDILYIPDRPYKKLTCTFLSHCALVLLNSILAEKKKREDEENVLHNPHQRR